MSNKFAGGIRAGQTSVSIPVVLRKTADSTENTGTVASGVTAYYWRQGGTPTALTSATDLAAITSAFSAGGWKEADSTHCPGLYRLDVDNAAFATGADWVVVTVKVGSCFLFVERFNLEATACTDLAGATGVNVTQVNSVAVAGVGSAGNPWGP